MDDYIRLNWICPITKQIFLEPVIADDGIIYENAAIQDWLCSNNNTSPITKEKISANFKPVLMVKTAVAAFLEKNPHEKENQYERSNKYMDNKQVIDKMLRMGNYRNLLLYVEFDIALICRDIGFEIFCEKAPEDVQKHFIDNCDNLLAKNKYNNPYLYYFFRNSSKEVLKHILTKNIGLDISYSDDENAVHIICQNKWLTLDVFKICAKVTKNIHVKNAQRKTPFDYLCLNHRDKPELIRYYIVNIIEMQDQNNNNATLINP